MSKPEDFDYFAKVKEESVDSTSSYDLSSDAHNIARFIDIDNYDEQGGYGFVDAMHAIMKEHLEEHQRNIEAREKIGVTVTKIFDGKSRFGEVVDYDAKRNWFKVVYESGITEDVDRDEVDRIVVRNYPMEVIRNHLDEPRVKKEKIEPVVERGDQAEFLGLYQVPILELEEEPKRKAKKAKTRGRKRGRPAKKPSTAAYVPLYRESKKDAYYWY